MREKQRQREKKKGRDRQREARNRSSHACLPKRTTLSAQEGGGESLPGQRAGRVGAGIAAIAFFHLLQQAV